MSDEPTIWKFPFKIDDEVKVEMPMGARLLHVGLDPSGVPCMWAAVGGNQSYSQCANYESR